MRPFYLVAAHVMSQVKQLTTQISLLATNFSTTSPPPLPQLEIAMSVFNLRGDQSFPSATTPSSTPTTREFGQKASMFPNHREYTTPPPEYQPPQVAFQATDPDDVLKQIPDMDLAIADLNSVPL